MDDKLLVRYDPVHFDSKGKLLFELKHALPGDVGYDLPVVVDERLKVQPNRSYFINLVERWFDIPPHGYAEVPCGLAVKVPDDCWGNIKARSSTGWRRRLAVNEAVIDSQYVGPLFILVFNPSNEPVRIKAGEKLAQLILIPKKREPVAVEVRKELPQTVRNESGFGSSGM